MTSDGKWFGPGLQPMYTPLWLQLSCQQRQAAGPAPGGELASCSAWGTGISQTLGRLDRRKEGGVTHFPRAEGSLRGTAGLWTLLPTPGGTQKLETAAIVGDEGVCRRKPCTPALDGDRCLCAVGAWGVGRREPQL